MRLIDADAIPMKDIGIPEEYYDWNENLILNYNSDIGCTSEDIENMPTIDPVQHGKWIDAQFVSPENGGKIIAKCSVCGVYTIQNRYKLNNFCAECGADMRGESDAAD